MDSIETKLTDPQSYPTQTLNSDYLPPPQPSQDFSSYHPKSGTLSKSEIHKPLILENGLTNTLSGTTDKDCSGGEEETSSQRRRRSRWDPPSDSNNNSNNQNGNGGTKKRKSRWADDELKQLIQLLDFMKDFTGGIQFDLEIQALNSRLLEISRMVQSGMPLDDRPEGSRSPSSKPVYDNMWCRNSWCHGSFLMLISSAETNKMKK